MNAVLLIGWLLLFFYYTYCEWRDDMKPKHRRGKNWDKDSTGRPLFRPKTWGKKDKDPKKDRREWKQGLTGF